MTQDELDNGMKQLEVSRVGERTAGRDIGKKNISRDSSRRRRGEYIVMRTEVLSIYKKLSALDLCSILTEQLEPDTAFFQL